jgi:hypothetical protein
MQRFPKPLTFLSFINPYGNINFCFSKWKQPLIYYRRAALSRQKHSPFRTFFVAFHQGWRYKRVPAFTAGSRWFPQAADCE